MKRVLILLLLAGVVAGGVNAWGETPKRPPAAPAPPPVASGFIRVLDKGFSTKTNHEKSVVSAVPKGGRAEKAGVHQDDLLVAIDGCPIKKRTDFIEAMRGKSVGQLVAFSFLRDGQPVETKIELTYFDLEEPLYAIRQLLYEEKKVSVAVMTGEVTNTTISDPAKLEVWGKAIKSNMSTRWENRFLKYYKNEPRFSIVDRQAVEQVLKELNFGQSGVVSEEFRAKMGKTLGATHLLKLEFSRFNDADTERQRLIEIETGKVLVSSTQELKKTTP